MRQSIRSFKIFQSDPRAFDLRLYLAFLGWSGEFEPKVFKSLQRNTRVKSLNVWVFKVKSSLSRVSDTEEKLYKF